MPTIGTMFTGFGGVDIGAMSAGLTPLWGIEYRADVAAVANHNLGDYVMVADVRNVDYAMLPHVDVLHASPVCTRASVANPNAEESDEDITIADAVTRAIDAVQPDIFTLENVWQYRNFASFRNILDTLGRNGYMYDFEHVNAADFGVPQTRKRMILRAVRGLLSPLPLPVPWVGWYAAIEDLLDTLPESKLAPWQSARLPTEFTNIVLIDGDSGMEKDGTPTVRNCTEPSMTIRSGRMPPHRIQFKCGKVVLLTPRILARLQTFPDSYELPTQRNFAAYGIGNAVPPLLYQRIIEGLVN